MPVSGAPPTGHLEGSRRLNKTLCSSQPFRSQPQRWRGSGKTQSRSKSGAALAGRGPSRSGARGLHTPASAVSGGAGQPRPEGGLSAWSFTPLPPSLPESAPKKKTKFVGESEVGNLSPRALKRPKAGTGNSLRKGRPGAVRFAAGVVGLGTPGQAALTQSCVGQVFEKAPRAERPTRAASSVRTSQ